MTQVELAHLTWRQAAADRDRGAEVMQRVVAAAAECVRTFAKLRTSGRK